MPPKAHLNPQKGIFWPQKCHFPDFPILTSVGGPWDRNHRILAVQDCSGRATSDFFGRPWIGRPQMWERVQVGFGSTGKKRKGPCTKQCAWRKHGSCDTRLAEACPPKLWNTVKYRVEKMRPKWPFWKHRAPKMRLVEAQCAYRKHCYPETPLGSPPTSGVSRPWSNVELAWTDMAYSGVQAQGLPFSCELY